MKKLAFLLFAFLTAQQTFAQVYVYDYKNSSKRSAIVLYQIDSNGFYNKYENVSQTIVNAYPGYNGCDVYAYDKKNKNLYVKNYYANSVVTVDDKSAKLIKKNKNIPQLKGGLLQEAIKKVNNDLYEYFDKLNKERQKQIEDSIAKAKEDSIRKVREDSIQKVQESNEKESYRKRHWWNLCPVPDATVKCTLCDEIVKLKDSTFCIGVRKDTMYCLENKYLALGEYYKEVHKFEIPTKFRTYQPFNYHIGVFEDSISHRYSAIMNYPEKFIYNSLNNALNEVAKQAPYGYFENWGWNSEYGFISFNFRYTNTNKKTIKYIDVYWKVTNDVNDVRKTGHFKGTGPLDEWGTASWNWDTSMYYVAGDATYMDITKVIITYMNGTTKVLNKSAIKFNYTSD